MYVGVYCVRPQFSRNLRTYYGTLHYIRADMHLAVSIPTLFYKRSHFDMFIIKGVGKEFGKKVSCRHVTTNVML